MLLRRWRISSFVVVTVRGISMRPALSEGDRVLVRRRVVPRRGQLVVIEQPRRTEPYWVGVPVGLNRSGHFPEGRQWMIKRVAAIAGDSVPADMTGNGSIDGRNVPEAHILLLGDNAAVSFDSRHLGFVPMERVLGTVWRILKRTA
ncbi:S26 family signal peptidase [Streptomyces sp. NPDC002589]|uniref:S26 family signal peptidase n=1 Tax=Streptomyces sp. NPDC002589 TaxID=3154420 RepID=UPI003322FF3D